MFLLMPGIMAKDTLGNDQERDDAEEFFDLNGNNIWDEAEEFIDKA